MLLGTVFSFGARLGESVGLKDRSASSAISILHWLEVVFAKLQNRELNSAHSGWIELQLQQGRRA